eukprot:1153554-Pelagomonas_calceolata.AAC.3
MAMSLLCACIDLTLHAREPLQCGPLGLKQSLFNLLHSMMIYGLEHQVELVVPKYCFGATPVLLTATGGEETLLFQLGSYPAGYHQKIAGYHQKIAGYHQKIEDRNL